MSTCLHLFRELKPKLPQVPLSSFVLTNAGEIVETQVRMARDRVRTIGISLLGGKSGVEGPYQLGIDSICAVNSEDVTKTPGMYVDS